MELPEALCALLDSVAGRVREDAETELSKTLSALAGEFAGRGMRGGPLLGAQTGAITASANDQASRTLSEVLRVVRETYGAAIPDSLAEPLREYLIGHAKGLGRRLNGMVLLKTKDLTIGSDIASRVAADLVHRMVRDIEIELGPALLRQQLRTLPAAVA